MDISHIKKRDGRIVPFDKDKLANAICKTARAVAGKDYETAQKLAELVIDLAQYIDKD